jgi:hypothetical protein
MMRRPEMPSQIAMRVEENRILAEVQTTFPLRKDDASSPGCCSPPLVKKGHFLNQ